MLFMLIAERYSFILSLSFKSKISEAAFTKGFLFVNKSITTSESINGLVTISLY
jgi:hypothetical protein